MRLHQFVPFYRNRTGFHLVACSTSGCPIDPGKSRCAQHSGSFPCASCSFLHYCRDLDCGLGRCVISKWLNRLDCMHFDLPLSLTISTVVECQNQVHLLHYHQKYCFEYYCRQLVPLELLPELQGIVGQTRFEGLEHVHRPPNYQFRDST